MAEDNWYSRYYKERYEKHFKPGEKILKEQKKSEFRPYYAKPYYPSWCSDSTGNNPFY